MAVVTEFLDKAQIDGFLELSQQAEAIADVVVGFPVARPCPSLKAETVPETVPTYNIYSILRLHSGHAPDTLPRRL